MLDVTACVAAIKEVTGCQDAFLPLHEPRFDETERSLLKRCIDTTFVSSVGEFVDEFEHRLADFTGVAHAVCVVNGTAALQIALEVAGVRRDDEVIAPSLTFVATANSISFCGAVPHFVDVSVNTLGMCPDALATHLAHVCETKHGQCYNKFTGRRISAVVPMHTFGHPCEIEAICEIAAQYGLLVIEDSTEALGSLVSGRHVGTFGTMGTLSFNGNKIITTGGGGAVLTDDPETYARLKHMTTTAKVPDKWEYIHDEVGYNFRLPNLNAALGCAQMDKLPAFIESKRRLAAKYAESFERLTEARLFSEADGSRSNYWLQALHLPDATEAELLGLMASMDEEGLMARRVWRPLHLLPPYTSCPRGALDNTHYIYDHYINIPSSSGLA